MMSKKEFFENEKECASLLGKTLSQYRKDIKNTKVPKTSDIKKEYNNDILLKMGLSPKILKKRRMI